jgi:hypothetical protein
MDYGGALIASAGKMKSVTKSTAKAEYVGTGEATKTALRDVDWLENWRKWESRQCHCWLETTKERYS